MEGQRHAIELETSGLDVRRGRRLVAIGEKKGIQALVLRRGRQCGDEEEQQRASDGSPPQSHDLHPLGAGTHTQG